MYFKTHVGSRKLHSNSTISQKVLGLVDLKNRVDRRKLLSNSTISRRELGFVEINSSGHLALSHLGLVFVLMLRPF